MKAYEKRVINGNTTGDFAFEVNMKRKKIPVSQEKFEAEYFPWDGREQKGSRHKKDPIHDWEAEVNYLFTGCENRFDLCHKMYPFWSMGMIKDIYSFMESTEQIQGNYELKDVEFGQLK